MFRILTIATATKIDAWESAEIVKEGGEEEFEEEPNMEEEQGLTEDELQIQFRNLVQTHKLHKIYNENYKFILIFTIYRGKLSRKIGLRS